MNLLYRLFYTQEIHSALFFYRLLGKIVLLEKKACKKKERKAACESSLEEVFAFRYKMIRGLELVANKFLTLAYAKHKALAFSLSTIIFGVYATEYLPLVIKASEWYDRSV